MKYLKARGYRQADPDVRPLREEDAYPAEPEEGYGWEKLYAEKLCRYYAEEGRLETRVARFHNVYGPLGTYEGGREKTPAAIRRKVALAHDGAVRLPAPSRPRDRRAGDDRLRTVLGWEPRIGLAEGLRRTYPWIEGELGKANRLPGESRYRQAVAHAVSAKPARARAWGQV